MPYKLKPGQENFEIMSGPDEGKQFTRGRVYDQVPKGFETRFEPVGAENLPPKKQAPEEKPSWEPGSPAAAEKSKIAGPKSKIEKGE